MTIRPGETSRVLSPSSGVAARKERSVIGGERPPAPAPHLAADGPCTMAERRQIRVLKHHPLRGSYERLLDVSDNVLHTVNPHTPCVTNTYSLHDVQLLETPNDGRRVRLRVPSRNCCGQLEVLALSPINPKDYEPLLKFVRDAITSTAAAAATAAAATAAAAATTTIAEVNIASPGELADGLTVVKGAWVTPSTQDRAAPSTVHRDRVAAEDVHAVDLERAVAAVAAVAHAAELEREAAALAAAAAEVVQAKADAEQLTEEGARQAAALRAAEAHATELQAALDGATRREAAAAAREVAAVARHMAATQAARDEANEMRQEAERAYEAELSRLELQVERAYAAEAQVNQRPPSHHLHAAPSPPTLLPRIPPPPSYQSAPPQPHLRPPRRSRRRRRSNVCRRGTRPTRPSSSRCGASCGWHRRRNGVTRGVTRPRESGRPPPPVARYPRPLRGATAPLPGPSRRRTRMRRPASARWTRRRRGAWKPPRCSARRRRSPR